MKRLPLLLLAAVASTLVACEREGPEDETKEAAAFGAAVVDSAKPSIEKVTAAFREALAKGDVKGIVDTYTTDAVSFQAGAEPLSSHDAITAGSQAFASAGTWSDVSTTTNELYPVGTDMVLEFASFSATMTPKGGKATPQKGRYMNLWKKQADGSWKVFRDMMVMTTPQ